MNIEIMANYADVVGGIAVLISLIYVGLQVRSNTRSSLSQTNMMAHESMANISLEIGKDAQCCSLLRKGLMSYSDLDNDEKFQFLTILTSLYRRYENVFYQNKKGLLEEELWKGYSHSMVSYMNTKGGKEFWKVRKGSFSTSFSAFLEDAEARGLFIPE
jgi:hypothetical protein